MKFYNSLTRRKEDFSPLDGKTVRMYTCGPTVYNFAHIGNFRAYIFEDVLRRALEYRGYGVRQVMNLTDVDDKTIRGARAEGVELRKYTEKYKKAFFSDLATLGVEPAEVYPAATDHIPEMISLISELERLGIAYKSEDGSVYYSVSKFPEYGKLAHLDRGGMRHGVRISNDEYEKDAVGDFALWKAWDADDGDVRWDSPWGPGRPGWHIECSAMSMKYLGESFDIHTGGIDNMFPHHENEIAQAEAVTGKQFAAFWLHCAHLRVNGEKMSKSLGNFFTLRDLTERGWSGREVRYVLMSGHYRQPLNFTFDALASARASLARIDAFSDALRECAGVSSAADPAPGWVAECVDSFGRAVDDDLNMPEAFSAVFSLVAAANKRLADGKLAPGEAAAAMAAAGGFNRILNVMRVTEDVPAEVSQLLSLREEARRRKDWGESDRLRAAISDLGWAVKDTPSGQKLTRR